jgi:radical SAM protein
MHRETDIRAGIPNPSAIDFSRTPFVAIWETTRSCDLACRHCRAEAIREALPGELTTEEGFALLDELAAMGTPICVLSGGDPAKRPDLCELVRHGNDLGMRMATVPAATERLTRELVQRLKDAGLAQMALSLDGPTAEIHDSFRGTPGAFDLTLRGARYAAEAGLPFQINTTFSEYNSEYFEEMARWVKTLGVVFWEVFFLVPMGRGREVGQMSAEQFEILFGKLAEFGRSVDFIVKITEAPHYRRYLMQRRRQLGEGHPEGAHPHAAGGPGQRDKGQLPSHMTRDFGPGGSIGLAPKGVNSGNGHLFVSYCGDICPSGFLPLACGNMRRNSLTEVYRSHPVFRDLRAPELFKGKCGICEFRNICGGSRARAYAMTGDYLAEEPFCAYEPKVQNAETAAALLTP